MKITYREEFTQSIRKLFKTETETYRRKGKAEELINDYFGELFDDLYDESEAVSESFNLELDKITLHGIELGFTLVPGAIEVYTVTGGSEVKNILDRLEDDGSAFISNRLNEELSDELLDKYFELAFAEILRTKLSS